MDIKKYIKEAHDYFVAAGEYVCPECEGRKYKIFKFGEVMDDGSIWAGKKPTEDSCPKCHGTGMDPNKNKGVL